MKLGKALFGDSPRKGGGFNGKYQSKGASISYV